MKRRLIKLASSLFTFIALVYAASPCFGKFHEPELPNELL